MNKLNQKEFKELKMKDKEDLKMQWMKIKKQTKKNLIIINYLKKKLEKSRNLKKKKIYMLRMKKLEQIRREIYR